MIVYDSDEDNTLPVIEKIRDNYDFKVRLEKNHYGKGLMEHLEQVWKQQGMNMSCLRWRICPIV